MGAGAAPAAGGWRGAFATLVRWGPVAYWSVRGAYLFVGPGAATAVVGGVLVLLVGLRGAAVLLEVHGLRAAGRPRPGAGEVLLLWLTTPSARLASTPEAPGLLYRWRGHLRREGAARRDLEHHRGGRVTVSVLYKDPEGEPVPDVPPFCRRSFTVEVEGGLITSNRSHPLVLGDPTTFWATLVADAAAGDLTVLRRGGDMCVVARVSFPRGARFAVVMAESDWDLVRTAHPARPAAGPAAGVTRRWARSP